MDDKLHNVEELARLSACAVVAAALEHGLELSPVHAAIAIFVHLPDHVLHLCL